MTNTRRPFAADQQHHSPPLSGFGGRAALLISLAALLVSLGYVFLVPSPTGDTFMTLAGGRDVADGKLAQPDDWSFNTDGRIWINQSWGTGLLFYGLWQSLGYFGLVAYKAVSIAVIGLFTMLGCRQLKVTYPFAILAAAFTLVAASSFINIRANLMGLAMLAMLIWLLYLSHGHSHRIWWAAGLLTLWAHMHGSFFFGIAVLGLWAVLQIGVARWAGGQLADPKPVWPFPVAVVLALVLATASPFGITNLTQPLSLMDLWVDEPWPLENIEMMPLLADHPSVQTLPGLPWYLLLLGLLAAPLIAQLLGPRHQLPRVSTLESGVRIKWAFTLALAAVTIVMAFQARRFVVISLIASAPLLAFGLQRLMTHRRYAWPTALTIIGTASCGILWQQFSSAPEGAQANLLAGTPVEAQRTIWTTAAFVIAFLPMVWCWLTDLRGNQGNRGGRDDQAAAPDHNRSSNWIARLRPRPAWAVTALALMMLLAAAAQMRQQLPIDQADGPLYPSDDLFGRLVVIANFPEQAARFLNDNDVQGNALNSWQWEGFLYWHRPQVKLMLGGRSRQVYTATDVRQTQLANGAKDVSVYDDLGIDLIVTDYREPLATRLFSEPQSPWQIIYFDGLAVIAARAGDPESEQLIRRFNAGTLTYPSEQAKAYSIAAARLALSSASSYDQIHGALVAATEIHPMPLLYQLFVFQQNRQRVEPHQIASVFESELVRLHGRNCDRRLGFEEMQSRNYLAQVMSKYYGEIAPVNRERKHFWNQYSKQCEAASTALAQGRPYPEISDIPDEFVGS